MKISVRIEILILLIILCLATILRLYKIDKIPPSLSWDEVAIGYNAYSVLKTQRDEYGVKLPLLFKSFGDYKLPGYIYLTALSEKIWGLNEFTVRFPSAILGVISVLGMYFLSRQLLNSPCLALFSSFSLAISPWHLQFSRAAFEANGALCLLIWGVFLTLKGIKKTGLLFIGIPILFASIYFYYTVRFLAVALFVVIIFVYRNDLIRIKKNILMAILLAFFLLIPLIPQFISKEGFQRLNQVSIFNAESVTSDFSIALAQNNNSLPAKIIYNRRFVYIRAFIGNYLKNNSLDFLFASGDRNTRHGPRGMGLLYLWELPFFLLGLYALLNIKERAKWFILSWIIIGPIPASLSLDSPHALRDLSTLPAFILTVTFGIQFAWMKVKTKLSYIMIKLLLFLLAIIISHSFLTYIFLYYDFTPPRTNLDWGDGNKQMVKKLTEVQYKYDTIFISGHYWKPYIYTLFYSQYNPTVYQNGGSDRHFDKYFFGNTLWEKKGPELGEENLRMLTGTNKTLFILSTQEASQIEKKLKESFVIETETSDTFGTPRFVFLELK